MIDADWQNPAKAEPVLARIPLGKFAGNIFTLRNVAAKTGNKV